MAEVAKRFDRYPNFAVDTSARSRDLAAQDPAVVRQFFQDYPDRILFGTDIVSRRPLSSELSPEERRKRLDGLEDRYRQEFAFFESDGRTGLRGREVQGLGLPEDILEKFHCANARAWYPGIWAPVRQTPDWVIQGGERSDVRRETRNSQRRHRERLTGQAHRRASV